MIDISNIDWIEYLQANSFQIPFLTKQEIYVHPNINAKSAIVYDINKDKILYYIIKFE